MSQTLTFLSDNVWFFLFYSLNLITWVKLKEYQMWSYTDDSNNSNPLLTRGKNMHDAMNNVYQYGTTKIRGIAGLMLIFVGFVGASLSVGFVGVSRWGMSVLLNYFPEYAMTYDHIRLYDDVWIGFIYNIGFYFLIGIYLNASRSTRKYDIFLGIVCIKMICEAYIKFCLVIPSGYTVLFPYTQ